MRNLQSVMFFYGYAFASFLLKFPFRSFSLSCFCFAVSYIGVALCCIHGCVSHLVCDTKLLCMISVFYIV